MYILNILAKFHNFVHFKAVLPCLVQKYNPTQQALLPQQREVPSTRDPDLNVAESIHNIPK